MADLSIAILGLGRTGVSIGLALQRYMSAGGQNRFTITGHDPLAQNETTAQKTGAVHRITAQITQAVEGQDLILLTLPYENVREAFSVMGEALRPGAVIVDLSPLKQRSLAWAEQYLKPAHHLVGGRTILNAKFLWDNCEDADHASAELFDGGLLLMAPSPGCSPEAIQLTSSFASILGSSAHFLDPDELDGLSALTETLPALMGAALFHQYADNPAWADLQRLINPSAGALLRPLKDQHPDALRDQVRHNADAVRHALDGLLSALHLLRDAIDEPDALEGMLATAGEHFDRWDAKRQQNDWDEASQTPSAGYGGITGSLFGEKLSQRLFGRNHNSN